MWAGRREVLHPNLKLHKLVDKAERLKANVWATEEHPFRVIKRQLGCAKAHYRSLQKNTARVIELQG